MVLQPRCSSTCQPNEMKPSSCLERTETPGDANVAGGKILQLSVRGHDGFWHPTSFVSHQHSHAGANLHWPPQKVTGHSVNQMPLLLSLPENSREKSFSPSPGRLFFVQARPPGGLSSGRRKTSRENKKPGVEQTTLSGPTCGSPYLMWSCNCGV